MTVTVWCPGDGVGHLTRAVAALHTLGVTAGEAVLLTNSPWACDPRATGGHATAPARLPLPAGVELWVDALPCGRGELDCHAVASARVVHHLARRLRWDAYRPHLPVDPPRFSTTWLTEPVDHHQAAWLGAHSEHVVELELLDPPAVAPRLDVAGAWLVVHSGPEAEVAELVAYARDTAAAEQVAPRLVVIGTTGLDVFPAWPLFPHAARIFTAAGANSVRQCRLHAPEVPHLMLPLARRWDDQPARARSARTYRWREPGGVHELLDRLPPPGERVAVRVTKDALRQIRGGHPWVFASSITSDLAGAHAGDLAVIFDDGRRFQGIGLCDPDSPIRVRMLHHGRPVAIDDDWWRVRFAESVERRSELFSSTDTTGFRCVHGENDGLPGLVVDRYGTALVIKLYTAAWVPHLRTVVAMLEQLLAPDVVVVRVSRALQRQDDCAITDGTVVVGEVPAGPVLFCENGLVLEADIVTGQKTGHFLDQRDNRALVGAEAAGARVLDVFACTGGFSLAAAAGGARSVHSVDLSAPALAAAGRNFAHNAALPAVGRCRHESTVGDAFSVMAALAGAGQRFDVVVVDPPSFAHREAGADMARRAYRRLTDLAVRLVEAGGLLVQASCSTRVSGDDFFAGAHASAAASGFRLAEVRRTGHPVDHPVGFPQGAYLKALFARVHRMDSVAMRT